MPIWPPINSSYFQFHMHSSNGFPCFTVQLIGCPLSQGMLHDICILSLVFILKSHISSTDRESIHFVLLCCTHPL